jgi:hypothetical protein
MSLVSGGFDRETKRCSALINMATRHVLQEPGRIIIDGGGDCTVYDKSKTGARLMRFESLELAPAFLLQHGGTTTRPCWLIWQAEGEAGVSFSQPEE